MESTRLLMKITIGMQRYAHTISWLLSQPRDKNDIKINYTFLNPVGFSVFGRTLYVIKHIEKLTCLVQIIKR